MTRAPLKIGGKPVQQIPDHRKKNGQECTTTGTRRSMNKM